MTEKKVIDEVNDVLYSDAPKEYFGLVPVGNSTDTFLNEFGALYTLEHTTRGRILVKHSEGKVLGKELEK